MTGKKLYLIVFFSFLLIPLSCQQGNKTPDVSHIPLSVKIYRFDQQFMTLDTTHLNKALSRLQHQYPEFFPVYMGPVMNFSFHEDSNRRFNNSEIRAFISSKDIRNLQDTVNAHFPPEKIRQINQELSQSFRYIKYYLPDFRPPRVITFISALANYGAITVDSVLGIGLDMFLGADFPLYKQVANPYPDYILRQFSPDYLVVSCIKVIEQQLYPMPLKGTLLDQMIAHGKQLYFLDKVMPQARDALKTGYSRDQLKWCKENEQYIWQYFIRNHLLYNSEALSIRHYIGPGPSSRGMPSEAPGNIGSWVGWQIVRKYMKENPGVSLSGLMKLTDGQKILSAARYSPH